MLAPFGTVSTSAVVDVGDIQVLSQKCDRVEADLARAAISFKEFIADVKVLVMAARIITHEHLPATPAKEIA